MLSPLMETEEVNKKGHSATQFFKHLEPASVNDIKATRSQNDFSEDETHLD